MVPLSWCLIVKLLNRQDVVNFINSDLTHNFSYVLIRGTDPTVYIVNSSRYFTLLIKIFIRFLFIKPPYEDFLTFLWLK